MRYYLLPLFFLSVFLLKLNAQQLPIFTQYRYQQPILNPASVSVDYSRFGSVMSVGGGVRMQWVGQPNTPQTQTAWGEYILAENFITGLYILNDKSGPTSMTGINGRIGYILSDDPEYYGLAVGFNFGMYQHRIRVTELTLQNQQQDVLGQQDQTQWFPDLGAGIYGYYTFNRGIFRDDLVYAGFSIPQVVGLDLTFREAGSDFTIQRLQHYYLTAGFYKFLGDFTFLEPSVWLKYVEGAPFQFDVNLRAHIQEYFWLGAGGSNAGTLNLEAGITIPEVNEGNLRIGYGFSYGFANTYGAFFGSSHEISVNYSR